MFLSLWTAKNKTRRLGIFMWIKPNRFHMIIITFSKHARYASKLYLVDFCVGYKEFYQVSPLKNFPNPWRANCLNVVH